MGARAATKSMHVEIENKPILIKPEKKFFNRLAKMAKRNGRKPGRFCMDLLEGALPLMERGELVFMDRHIAIGGKR